MSEVTGFDEALEKYGESWKRVESGEADSFDAALEEYKKPVEERSFLGDVIDWTGKGAGMVFDAFPVHRLIDDDPKEAVKTVGRGVMHTINYLDMLGNPVRVAADDWKNAVEWARAMGYDTPLRPAENVPGAFPFNRAANLIGWPRVRDDDSVVEIWGKGLLKGARGIKDEDDPRGRIQRGQDWLDPKYVEEHPIGSFFGGMLSEVALDPLTYTPVAAVSLPFKFVKHLVNAFGKTKAGDRVLNNDLMQGLNVYVGNPAKIKAISRRLQNEISGGDYFGALAAGQSTREMDNIAKELGMTSKELHMAVLRTLEGYLPGQKIISEQTSMFNPAVKREVGEVDELARVYKETWERFLQDEIDRGVPISDLMKNYDELQSGTADVMGYVPHVITQIAKRSQGRGDFADWFKLGKTRGGHARKRETTGTIESQNIAAIKSEKVGKDVEYKYTNPAQLNFWREAWHNRAVANSKLREEVRQFGRLDEGTNRIPIEYEYYTPQRALKKAKLKDDDGNVLYFDPMEAAAFKRQSVLLSDPKELGAFLKTWDKTQNWWKLYALITRPAYYTRNLAGNYSNAYLLAGLTDPQRYGDAGALQLKAFRVRAGKAEWGNSTVMLGGGKRMPSNELWEAFVMRGLHNRGQYGLHGDIAGNLDTLLGQAASKGPLFKRVGRLFIPSSDNELAQLAFRVFGATPENNARAAVFIDQLGKMNAHKLSGKALDDAYDKAADVVRGSMFDYTDISKFERDWAKRAFPFYKWSRSNIPAQLLHIMERPDRYQKLNLAIQNMQYGVDVPHPEELQNWIQGRAPMVISANAAEDVYKVIPLLNWVPTADLVQMGNPKQLIEQMASPFLKLPMEYWANYDSFRKGDIKKYKGETADFLGVKMPVYMHRFLTNLVFLSELDRVNPWEIFGAQIPDPETGEVNIRKTSYEPFFEGLHKAGITDTQLEGASRETRMDFPSETLSGSRGGRLLQFLTGLRVYSGKMTDQETRRALNIRSDLKQAQYLLALAEDRGQSRRIQELQKFIADREAEFDAVEDMIQMKRSR